MPEFLVELYVPRADQLAAATAEANARQAAAQLTREGTPVRYLRAIFVPEDETCFHLYEAATADEVRRAADRAGLTVERLSAAVLDPHANRRKKGSR